MSRVKIPQIRLPKLELMKVELFKDPILVITAEDGTDMRIHDETVVQNILHNQPVNVVASSGAMSVQPQYVSSKVVEKLENKISSFETQRDRYAQKDLKIFGISLLGGILGSTIALSQNLDALSIALYSLANFGLFSMVGMIYRIGNYQGLINKITNYKEALRHAQNINAYNIREAPDNYIFELYSELPVE